MDWAINQVQISQQWIAALIQRPWIFAAGAWMHQLIIKKSTAVNLSSFLTCCTFKHLFIRWYSRVKITRDTQDLNLAVGSVEGILKLLPVCDLLSLHPWLLIAYSCHQFSSSTNLERATFSRLQWELKTYSVASISHTYHRYFHFIFSNNNNFLFCTLIILPCVLQAGRKTKKNYLEATGLSEVLIWFRHSNTAAASAAPTKKPVIEIHIKIQILRFWFCSHIFWPPSKHTHTHTHLSHPC